MSKAKTQRAGLVALVNVAVFVDGVRTEFAPGDELPQINAHDAQELLRAGSVEDPADKAKAERADAKAQSAADRAFEDERAQVQLAAASTATAPAADAA
jgi:hypothetical protein